VLEFKPEYSVGVARIDAQHRKLFQWVNELEQAMRQGRGRDVLDKVLSGLVAYTREHFAAEEELMLKTGYPELAQHKAVHDGFIRRTAELQQRHQAGEVGVSVELASSLGDWIRNHVLGMDKRYAPHMAARKVA